MNQPSGALNTTLANVHIQLPRSILSASGRRLSGNSGHSNVNAVGVSCGAAATSSHSPTGSSFSDNASRNNLAGVVSCTGSIGAKRGLRVCIDPFWLYYFITHVAVFDKNVFHFVTSEQWPSPRCRLFIRGSQQSRFGSIVAGYPCSSTSHSTYANEQFESFSFP